MKKKILMIIGFFLAAICLFACEDNINNNDLTLKINDSELSWNAYENAVEYEIYVDDVMVDVTIENSYLLKALDSTHNIKIIANLIDGSRIASNKVTYRIKPSNTSGNVNLIAINDTHGAIVDDENNVGIAKVASVIKEITATGEEYIKVANGDIFQGTYASNITHGKILVDVLNALNFDLFVIGNHEFDWGIEEIAKYKDGDLSNGEANFPFLAANIIDKRTSSTLEWTDDYTIIENNGFRVGVIGVIGEGLTSSIASDKIANYEFLDPVPIVKNLSKKLRNEEACDVIIVATHEYENSTNMEYADLSEDSRIDGIICGHTHQKISEKLMRSDGNLISVMQSNTKNYTIGQLQIKIEELNYKGSNIYHYYPENYLEDSNILEIINNYNDIIAEGDRVVGKANSYMSRYELGIYATSAMRLMFDTDFGCMNTGGVRDEIYYGDIKVKDIYNVFPFDNEIYIVKIKGSILRRLYLNQGNYLYFDEQFDYYYLEDDKVYELAVIDYVFTSVYYYDSYFKKCEYTKTGKYIRDAVIYALDNNK